MRSMEKEEPDNVRPWHEIVHEELKRADVRLATYVPDNVLSPLIRSLHDDDHFTTFCAAREEEAVGIATGAWMGGMLGVVLMQTSGFATLANALASLAVPYQIPLLMFVSERGTLGEFNLGQTMVCRTMRPALDSLGSSTIRSGGSTSSPSSSSGPSGRPSPPRRRQR
jgi:sulfopyruvate decarboxylase TPP-binding subunit